MNFVRKRDDIVDNLKTLEGYLHSKNEEEKKFAVDIVKNAPALVAYKVNGENHFAPGNFVAYTNNNMKEYLENEDKEGKDPDGVITKIVGNPFFNNKIDEKYQEYVSKFVKSVPENTRTFWRIKDERRKNLDISL